MANILAVDDNLELCKLICTALERDCLLYTSVPPVPIPNT